MRWGVVPSSVLCAAIAVVTACAKEQYPAWLVSASQTGDGGAPATDGSVATPPGPTTCIQARATSLAARLVAVSATASSGGAVILLSDVFQSFLGACGQCHGPIASLGGFQIPTAAVFRSTFTQAILDHALSDGASNPAAPMNPADPKDPMPPFNSGGMPYSKRSGTDPVKQFADLAQAWIRAGSPNSFMPSQRMSDADAGSSQYLMPPLVGGAMTNLGDCIPGSGLVGIEQTKSGQLDEMFASLKVKPSGTAAEIIGLPEHLGDTDLFTLDSRALAPYGVIGFAPGYPLWSDDAGKLRHVRIPRGTSIHFNKETQQFEIPPNTRFYKTFMKRIIDTDGSIRWRKIETRLIVSRPDVPGAEGYGAPTAIYGAYRWNDAETDAVLVATPFRDGTPWGDTMLQYKTDEQLAALILGSNPADPDEALLEAKASRHYAIPSRQRCVECHMGSAGQNFVLGFLPLQINRRPMGEGGVIEETGPDELTQLQRFIDYGLITGVDSPADILPLEKSEGSRAPRNDPELKAQGYMLGNCSHCHNPRGNPSIDNPALKTVVNFLPGPNGGIFQFPLEKYSPRIFRGTAGATQMPYITPSLMDQPRHDPITPANFVINHIVASSIQATPPSGFVDYAPWRSLIYRNVDTAFSYTDDEALLPHMPRNTPGYDPRAKQILSDWMVSIPAVLKRPELNEYAFCTLGTCPPGTSGFANGLPDENEQPYAEVLPGDPRYPSALSAAQKRLGILHTGLNPALPPPEGATPPSGPAHYADPEDTADIVDPATLRDPVCNPIPTGVCAGIVCSPPYHPQWVIRDTTELPGPFRPRRADWIDKLALGHTDTPSGCGGAAAAANLAARKDEEDAVALLRDVRIDAAFRSYATKKIPYGLWQKKPGCDFSSEPTLGSISANQSARWMSGVHGASATDPVYTQTPGAAVFKSICINCHGSLADSSGRLAANLTEMTGGLARPANFRDGLFGPVGATADTSNRHVAFGAMALPANTPGWNDDANIADDDRAARYMSWMALGGTQVLIPQPILQIVSLTRVLGARRPYLPAVAISANMLSTAKTICQTFLGPFDNYRSFNPVRGADGDLDGNTALILTNADGETWFKLCSQGHPAAPVRVIQLHMGRCGDTSNVNLCEEPVFDANGNLTLQSSELIDPSTYPVGAPVGNGITGELNVPFKLDNPWPWCVQRIDANVPADYASKHNLPECPQGVNYWSTGDGSRWATRGAINAGLAVFLYVQQLESKTAPDPDYDQCEQLGTTAHN